MYVHTYIYTHTHTHTLEPLELNIHIYISRKKKVVYLRMETEKEIEYKSVYNKKRYEQNKEEILKCGRERYKTIHKKDLNIKVGRNAFSNKNVLIEKNSFKF